MIRLSKRFLVVILFLIAATVSLQAKSPSTPHSRNTSLLRVTFLDVGQGDAIMLRSGGKTILIDAGDDRANAAKASIIPFCKKEGIKKIDVAVISHPHRDHFGGFIDLLQEIPVGEILYSTDSLGTQDPEEGGNDAELYQRLYNIIKEKQITYTQAKVASKYDWGKDVKVELLHEAEGVFAKPNPNPMILSASVMAKSLPERIGSDPIKISANEQSLIFKVTCGKISYLFTGDAEKGAETSAIESFRDRLPSTILKSGHHGSKTSSCASFMEFVKPEYGVISVGKYNSFKHPSPETLNAYEFFKMKVFRTDQDGTVDSNTDGETVHFISNQSPLEFTSNPQVISLTPNSATLQWGTNKLANTVIEYGIQSPGTEKAIEQSVTNHTITVTGLKPGSSYVFKASSKDARINDQVVSFEGSFKTPAGDGNPLPKIVAMGTNFKQIYARKPFQVIGGIDNPANQAVSGVVVELYHTAISSDMLLGKNTVSIPANGNVSVAFPVEITWIGSVDLLLVVKINNQIVDTSSLNVQVVPKLLYIDAAHGNIDYFTGKFAGMKMDLSKTLGFEMRSISKPINLEMLKDAFIVVIPDPDKDYASDELTAIKQFVSKGGALYMFSRSDYASRSHPQILNTVLNAVGSNIRFNDDEVCDPTNNIGTPWGVMLHVFPSQIVQNVQKLLVRNSCSLVNRKLQGLSAGKTLQLLATGDDDSYNLDADLMNDAWFYASHTPKLPMPVVACEDLGMGRVACAGEPLYDDKLYAANNQMQTPQFNQCVISWLSLAKDKTLKEILQACVDLDTLDDPELSAMRYEEMKTQVAELVDAYLSINDSDTVKDAFSGTSGKAVSQMKKELGESLKFKSVHGEANSATQELLNGF